MHFSSCPILNILCYATVCSIPRLHCRYTSHRLHSSYHRNLFNLRKLQSQTKTTFTIIRELLFANDCALAAHTLQEAQTLLDRFVAASRRLGLCVILQKTEPLLQPSPDSTYTVPMVTVDNTPLPVAVA